MAKINACLFDLDGVLVDTARYHYLAWKRLCNELGFDLSEEENEELKGISRAKSLDILLDKGGIVLSDSQKEKYMARKNEWYLEYVNSMDEDELLPGAHDFLEACRQAEKKIGLGTASKNAMRIIEKLNIVDFFDVIIDGTKVSRGKPDPQTFSLGAEALKLHPSQCVVFEDSIAGIEAGIAGGMYTIGVGDPQTLKRANIVIPGFKNVGIDILNDL
jgi:beta-phosphoglucomutase